MLTLTSDQLQAIQQALALVDPGGRRKWTLEVYTLRDGVEVLDHILDLRTGKPIKPRALAKLRGEESKAKEIKA